MQPAIVNFINMPVTKPKPQDCQEPPHCQEFHEPQESQESRKFQEPQESQVLQVEGAHGPSTSKPQSEEPAQSQQTQKSGEHPVETDIPCISKPQSEEPAQSQQTQKSGEHPVETDIPGISKPQSEEPAQSQQTQKSGEHPVETDIPCISKPQSEEPAKSQQTQKSEEHPVETDIPCISKPQSEEPAKSQQTQKSGEHPVETDIPCISKSQPPEHEGSQKPPQSHGAEVQGNKGPCSAGPVATVGVSTRTPMSHKAGVHPVIIDLSDDDDDDEAEDVIDTKHVPSRHSSIKDRKILFTRLANDRNYPALPQHAASPGILQEGRGEGETFWGRQVAVAPFPYNVPGVDIQCSDRGNSFETAMVPEPRWAATTIGTFTVQCNLCGKWRIIPTKEQYHAIGQRVLEKPWVCEEARAWREDASCEKPSDLSEDEPSILWAVDKHSIPEPPHGFHRRVVIRGELSRTFADVYVLDPCVPCVDQLLPKLDQVGCYYKTPCGKTLRSMVDVQRFLDDQPLLVETGVKLSQFSFTRPKPGPGVQKRTANSSVGDKTTKRPCLPSPPALQLPTHFAPFFAVPLAVMNPILQVPHLQLPETPTMTEEQLAFLSSAPVVNGHALYPIVNAAHSFPGPYGSSSSPWQIYQYQPFDSGTFLHGNLQRCDTGRDVSVGFNEQGRQGLLPPGRVQATSTPEVLPLKDPKCS